MAKKPRKPKDEREREAVDTACTALAAELTKLVGFDVHIEHVGGAFYKPAGAISLNTMNEIVARLKRKEK